MNIRSAVIRSRTWGKNSKSSITIGEWSGLKVITETWRIVNEIINKRQSNSPPVILNVDDKVLSDPIEVANAMNEYFVTAAVIPYNTRNLCKIITEPTTEIVKTFEPASQEELVGIIKKLKVNVSVLGSFKPKLMKRCMEHLTAPILAIVNRSLDLGVVPSHIKIAKTVAIYKKKGDRTKPENYRPISVLPLLSTILEKVVRSRMLGFLYAKKKFSERQFGFIAKRSTLDAVFDMITQIEQALDNFLTASLLLIDFRKAFESLNHKVLLHKLQSAGFHDTVLNWFTSYLQGRKQFVTLQSATSSLRPITIGVPQGSVLGPLLFAILINDLAKCSLHGKLSMYADDTNIMYYSKNKSELKRMMKEDLLTIDKWIQVNSLQINVEKTNYIILSKLSQSVLVPFDLEFRDAVIKRVQSAKYLGLVLDEQLSWSTHIEYRVFQY